MSKLSFFLLALLSSSLAFVHTPKYANGLVTQLQAALSPGDSVVVIGGTGGVGQLVTKKLQAESFPVTVASRDPSRGRETLGSDVNVVELDLLGSTQAQVEAILKDAKGLVISVGTTAFPTAKWKGGNTPKAIDEDAVTKLAQAAASSSSLKKVILVTSVGVDRTGELPFLILNLFGVLNAKKAGEQAIMNVAAKGEFEYCIVRPGRLVGGPFTNLDVARLLQVEGGAENGVEFAKGDDLLGDCKRDACAESIVQALLSDEAKNIDFSIISTEQPALTASDWKLEFQKLQR